VLERFELQGSQGRDSKDSKAGLIQGIDCAFVGRLNCGERDMNSLKEMAGLRGSPFANFEGLKGSVAASSSSSSGAQLGIRSGAVMRSLRVRAVATVCRTCDWNNGS